MEIIFKYYPLLLLPIVVFAALFSFLLYSSKKAQEIPVSYRVLLASIRFLIFTLLGLFLLSPMLKSYIKEIQKPALLVAVDNSQSMVFGADSVKKVSMIHDFISELTNKYNEDFDLYFYSFGSEVESTSSYNFKNQSSNLSQAIQSIHKQNRHRNIGALVMVSDGIFNVGSNPIFDAENLRYPIYSFGFGDTTRYKDLLINRLVSNEIAFSGDKFPVIIDVKSVKCMAQKPKLHLFANGVEIESVLLDVKSNYQIDNFQFRVNADKPGLLKLVAKVDYLDDEFNLSNNIAEFYVEVIDSRQKILITYQAPHPDIAAITRAIKTSDNYIVDQKPWSPALDFNSYNLVIIHGLPSSNVDFISLKNKLTQSAIPYLLFLNSDLNPNFFNSLQTGLTLVNSKSSAQSVLPVFNSNFSAFSSGSDFTDLISELSPITMPYAVYKGYENLDIVLNQRIGSVSTGFPLMFLNLNLEVKNGVFMGEGIWRWWLISHNLNGHSLALDQFFLNIVRSLSLKVSKERFKIQHQNIYTNIDEINLRALVYNASYEAITEPEVVLILTNTDSKNEFTYYFNRRIDDYNLTIGNIPPGNYSFKSKVNLDGVEYSKTGRFVVQTVNRETANLEANFQTLGQMARLTNGKFWSVLSSDSLDHALNSRDDLVSLESKLLKYSDLIDFYFLLIFLALLIAIEWFLRKFLGIY